jgi:gliding motility-associated-like protein
VNFQNATSFNSLAGGAYTLKVRDGLSCEMDFPVNVTFPGFVNSTISKINADCANNGNSGSITVAINDPGTFTVALSNDQFNVPPANQFLTYSNPSVTFSNLARGQYFVYIKSNSAACPTRSAAIDIQGIFAISFDIQPQCTGNKLSIALINIVGEPNVPFEIWVYKKFTNVVLETIPETSIPATGSVFLAYDDHSFLRISDEYQIQIVQIDPSVICEVRSPLTDLNVTAPLSASVGERKKSYPDIATGSMQLTNFFGGLAPYDVRIQLDSASSLALPAFDTQFERVTPNNNQVYEKIYENIPPGRYIVQVSDSLGCSVELLARVPLDIDIFVPNIFTPNDDGANDEFYIRNLPQEADVVKLMVTSRWGKEVYNTNNYRNNWKGDGVADGVYFYKLQIGSANPITGWVEILRGQKP